MASQKYHEVINRVQSVPKDRRVPDYPRIEKILKVVRKESPGLLLDVGYQPGSFADYLITDGWKCTALDLNPHQEDSSIKFIRCDLNEGFPVENEQFDVVTAGEIVEHMLDETAFIGECHRVLKPNGKLVITTPNLNFLWNRFLVLMGKLPRFVASPYHYHFHNKNSIVSLLESQGFKIDKISSSHLFYSRLRHKSGIIFEWLGDLFPTLGAHLIVFARKI